MIKVNALLAFDQGSPAELQPHPDTSARMTQTGLKVVANVVIEPFKQAIAVDWQALRGARAHPISINKTLSRLRMKKLRFRVVANASRCT